MEASAKISNQVGNPKSEIDYFGYLLILDKTYACSLLSIFFDMPKVGGFWSFRIGEWEAGERVKTCFLTVGWGARPGQFFDLCFRLSLLCHGVFDLRFFGNLAPRRGRHVKTRRFLKCENGRIEFLTLFAMADARIWKIHH